MSLYCYEGSYHLRVKVKQIIFILLAVFILLLPLLLYIYQFGLSLSTEHSRWSEFGSYLTGIYSPLIALVALFILTTQLLIQRAMSKHHHDQAFVNSAREDINFYINKLENYLDRAIKGSDYLMFVGKKEVLPY